MDNLNVLYEKSFKEFVYLKNTPDEALQLLLSHFSSEAHKAGDEPIVVFLAYIRVIMRRILNAGVDFREGLRMAVMCSRKIPVSHIAQVRHSIHSEINPTEWLMGVLCNSRKRLNPYFRLDLLCLFRIYQVRLLIYEGNVSLQRICSTFICAMSEIQPQRLCRLYPSGNADESSFDVRDLMYIISLGRLQDIRTYISTDIFKKVCKSNNVCIENVETKFFSNCIQLIGVSAVIAGSIPDVITSCIDVFKFTVNCLVDSVENLPGMSRWAKFRYVVSHSSVGWYAIQTVHDLTAAIMNNKMPDTEKTSSLRFLRNITGDLDVYNKPCDLPRLLMNRQVQSSMLTRQHSSLITSVLKNLSPEDYNDDDSENANDESDVSFDDFDNSNSNSDNSDNDSNYSHNDSDNSINESNYSHNNDDHLQNDSEYSHSDSDF